jgi:hypothetical protein
MEEDIFHICLEVLDGSGIFHLCLVLYGMPMDGSSRYRFVTLSAGPKIQYNRQLYIAHYIMYTTISNNHKINTM